MLVLSNKKIYKQLIYRMNFSNKQYAPNHEYSKYIDQQFSFDNKIQYPNKFDLVDSTKNLRCDGSIMLEPRLQEYLKKKKYYKLHNIKPCISLEKEFQITRRDKRLLRVFINGHRDIYTNDKYNYLKTEHSKKKYYFPSKKFRDNDSRVPVLKKHQNIKPINRGMFVPDDPYELYYEDPIQQVDPIMDARDLCSNVTGFALDDTRFDPRNDPNITDIGFEEYNKYRSQYRINPHIKKNNKQKINNNNNQSNAKISYTGTNNKRYGKIDQPTFSEKSDMDTNNKMVIPKVSTNSKRSLSTYDYKVTPFIGQERSISDAEFETTLIRGMPSHTTKSYGYRNPQEHYFHYIEEDFNNPDNVVEAYPRGGISTRHENKKLAKQKYTREII